MKKDYSKWSDSEVVKLFKFIEECKRKNIVLVKAFERYGMLTGRKTNSVRNYYYAELNELENNESRRSRLNLSLNSHIKTKFKEFDKKEEYDLIYFIIENKLKGKSVRSSCLKLANNNVNDMIRYQNKYRSVLKKDPNLIKEITNKIAKEKGISNVVNFPKPKPQNTKGKITDEEIKSLFMGLVRLVKKSATHEANINLKKEISLSQENLRKTLVTTTEKQKQIVKLTETNKLLSSKIEKLENKIKNMRVSNVKNKKAS